MVDDAVESRTFNQLRQDSYGLAEFLYKKGYNGKHICVLGGTSYEWMVSFLAVVMSGNVVVPMDKMLPEKEMLFLFGKGDVDCIMYSGEYEKIAEHGMESVECVKEIIKFKSDVFKEALTTKGVELPKNDTSKMVEYRRRGIPIHHRSLQEFDYLG